VAAREKEKREQIPNQNKETNVGGREGLKESAKSRISLPPSGACQLKRLQTASQLLDIFAVPFPSAALVRSCAYNREEMKRNREK
jgi:hypothetical protein